MMKDYSTVASTNDVCDVCTLQHVPYTVQDTYTCTYTSRYREQPPCRSRSPTSSMQTASRDFPTGELFHLIRSGVYRIDEILVIAHVLAVRDRRRRDRNFIAARVIHTALRPKTLRCNG